MGGPSTVNTVILAAAGVAVGVTLFFFLTNKEQPSSSSSSGTSPPPPQPTPNSPPELPETAQAAGHRTKKKRKAKPTAAAAPAPASQGLPATAPVSGAPTQQDPITFAALQQQQLLLQQQQQLAQNLPPFGQPAPFPGSAPFNSPAPLPPPQFQNSAAAFPSPLPPPIPDAALENLNFEPQNHTPPPPQPQLPFSLMGPYEPELRAVDDDGMPAYVPYVNSNYGVSFEHPVDWQQEESAKENVQIVKLRPPFQVDANGQQLPDPPVDEQSGVECQLIVIVELLSAPLSLDEYKELCKQTVLDALSSYSDIDIQTEAKCQIAGRDAWEIVYTQRFVDAQNNPCELRLWSVFTVAHNKAFCVQYISSREHFRHDDEVRHIARTLQIHDDAIFSDDFAKPPPILEGETDPLAPPPPGSVSEDEFPQD